MLVAATGCSGRESASPSGGLKTLTIVAQQVPARIGLLDRQGGPDQTYTDLAADVLVVQDPDDGTLSGQLATAWKQTSPQDWEFTLRHGVKFHDGTDFNAEAAAWAITTQTAEGSTAGASRYAPNLEASANGDYTVDIHCPTECPILDRIATKFQFESPTWAKANPDKTDNWPMGTGPFYLAEYKDGEYLLYKKFDQYWGDTGYFDQVKIVWRSEPSVRASMVANGEAQLTRDLTPQDINAVPQVIRPSTANYAMIRLRDRDASGKSDPVWGDVRFRQALAYAIDCDAMVKTLMNGVTDCAALPFNPISTGWTDQAKRYPYDPAKARELLDQVLGPGKEYNNVHIVGRAGDFPKTWAETIMSYWADVGVNATFEYLDGDRQAAAHQPGVHGMPPDAYIIPGHTNDLYDASLTLSYIDGCNEVRSYSVCDPVFAERLAQARAAGGEERANLQKQLAIDYFMNGAHIITLWQTPAIYGAAANLEWDEPDVGWMRPDKMRIREPGS